MVGYCFDQSQTQFLTFLILNDPPLVALAVKNMFDIWFKKVKFTELIYILLYWVFAAFSLNKLIFSSWIDIQVSMCFQPLASCYKLFSGHKLLIANQTSVLTTKDQSNTFFAWSLVL